MKCKRISRLGALSLAGFFLTAPIARHILQAENEPPAIRQSPLSEEQKAAHVLSRLAYGPRPGDADRVKALGVARFIEQQLHPRSMDDDALAPRLQGLESIHLSTIELAQLFPRGGVVKRLVDEGVIDESQLPRRRFRRRRGEGDSAAQFREEPPGEPGAGMAMRRGRNLIYEPIRRLPEPVRVPGRGRNFPPILGINPQQQIVAQLQAAKMIRAVHSERQLEELMVDFWFNHFNVFMRKGIEPVLVPGYERDVIRPYALGKFGDLLGATAHSPAMLFYLDNFQSVSPESTIGQRRDRGLNENYARELMELHTLGVDGGYTQQDVIEVAKVFTGWTFLGASGSGNRMSRRDNAAMGEGADLGFRFVRSAHAPGDKRVLGQTIRAGGVEEGEQVLDLLARHPSTARFLAAKLVRRFVADDPPPALVTKVAKTYEKTGGDIREMLRTVFYSPEFWSEEAFRSKTKKPLEFVASSIRALDGEVTPAPLLLAAMERMGEPLYLCQPPTGYPEAAGEWLNSGTLLYRWKFAIGVASAEAPGIGVPRLSNLRGRQASHVVAQLMDDLLPGVSAAARKRLESTLAEQQGKRPNPEAALEEREVRYVAGLVLGSPEFQQR